ncbi:unnamed protein product [Urochloa humidicola]
MYTAISSVSCISSVGASPGPGWEVGGGGARLRTDSTSGELKAAATARRGHGGGGSTSSGSAQGGRGAQVWLSLHRLPHRRLVAATAGVGWGGTASSFSPSPWI